LHSEQNYFVDFAPHRRAPIIDKAATSSIDTGIIRGVSPDRRFWVKKKYKLKKPSKVNTIADAVNIFLNIIQ
jgi:hypothetical protein